MIVLWWVGFVFMFVIADQHFGSSFCCLWLEIRSKTERDRQRDRRKMEGEAREFKAPEPTQRPTQAPDAVEILYKKPQWSSENKTDIEYWIEVIKEGVVLETIPLKDKEFFLFGRHPICDIVMENPTVSRQHCAFQMHSEGCVFFFDMESAQGTLINKRPAKSNRFVLLRPGDVMRLGQSTRLLVFCSSLTPEEFDDRFQLHAQTTSAEKTSEEKTESLEDGQIFEGNMTEVEQFLRSRGLRQEHKTNTSRSGSNSLLNKDEDSRRSRPSSDSFALEIDDKIVPKGPKKGSKQHGKGGNKGSKGNGNEEDEEDDEDEEVEFFDDLGGNRVEGYDFYLGRDSYENHEDDEYFDRTKQPSDRGQSGGSVSSKNMWRKPLLSSKKKGSSSSSSSSSSKGPVETSASVRSKLMILLPQIREISRKIQISSSFSSSSSSSSEGGDSLDSFLSSVSKSLDVC